MGKTPGGGARGWARSVRVRIGCGPLLASPLETCMLPLNTLRPGVTVPFPRSTSERMGLERPAEQLVELREEEGAPIRFPPTCWLFLFFSLHLRCALEADPWLCGSAWLCCGREKNVWAKWKNQQPQVVSQAHFCTMEKQGSTVLCCIY